jgi:hypothetical protein
MNLVCALYACCMSTASSESEVVEGNCEILLLPCCNGGQYLLMSKEETDLIQCKLVLTDIKLKIIWWTKEASLQGS